MNTPLSSVGELFSEAWRRYKASIEVTAKIAFVLALLTQILVVFPPDAFKSHPFLSLLYFVVAMIIIVWFGTTLTIAMYYATEDEGRGEWQSYYDRARPVWGRFFRTKLLQIIITGIGFIFFVIPGVVLFAKFIVADWVAIFEGLSARDSMRRSGAYVRGKLWDVFSRLLLLLFTLVPAEIILNLSVYSKATTTGALLIQALINIVILTFIAPWSIAYLNAVYNDLRKTESTVSAEPVTPTTPA